MPSQSYSVRQRSAARYLLRSVIFLLALAVLGALFYGPLIEGFHANAYLNGTILAMFGFGVVYTLKALVDLLADARGTAQTEDLIAAVRRGDRTFAEVHDIILANPHRSLREFLNTVHRVIRHGETSATLPYLLDSLATRGEDRRALVRYLTGALVLLGLIGTFYGLLITIEGVRQVIGGLSDDGASRSTVELLGGLKDRLAVPLSGMGMAFSTSLFGLLASLALAFLELQLFHAHNSVQVHLESLVVSDLVPMWQAPASLVTTAAEPASTRYLAALVQATVERLDRIAATIDSTTQRGDAGDRVSEQLAILGERVRSLDETLKGAERDRTADLRHELRVIAHMLSRRASREDAPDHAPQT